MSRFDLHQTITDELSKLWKEVPPVGPVNEAASGLGARLKEDEMDVESSDDEETKPRSNSYELDSMSTWDRECARLKDLSSVECSSTASSCAPSASSCAATASSCATTTSCKERNNGRPTEHQIRERAYFIWLDSGDKDQEANYYRAEWELSAFNW